MRSLTLAAALLLAALPVCAQQVVKLWPSGLPAGSVVLPEDQIAELKQREAETADTDLARIRVVTDPKMTVYKAPAPNGCAVIVVPGGGYNILASDHEGLEIAGWLNGFGVTAIVLEYRVPRRDPETPHVEPLQDAQRALRLTRYYAEDWGIDPDRLGILGFSAGGHLTVMAGTHWDETTYPAVDSADKLSARPDFMVPIYAAYLHAKEGDVLDTDLVRVTSETPPTFMAVTWDDAQRGRSAAQLFVELKMNDVPAELHIYSKGGHGYGIRRSENPVQHWNDLCEDWMRVSGFLDK